MPVVPSPRYESANSSLLLPGFSRYLLYLSFSISLSLSLSSLSSLSDHSRASVFLASYHRTVPPASRRPRSTINYRISRYVQRSLFLVQNCIVRIVFFCFFFFDIIKATATRYSFLPFDNITFHVPAREKVRLVPRAPLFFQKQEKKEREREKCARSRVLCENGFSRRDGYSRLGQRLAYPLKPEPADLRNGTEVSLVL